MRFSLLCVLVAALSAVITALSTAGCSSVCSANDGPVVAGSYVISGYDSAGSWHADNYQLTLSADRRSVVEVFDLDGKHYELHYSSVVRAASNPSN